MSAAHARRVSGYQHVPEHVEIPRPLALVAVAAAVLVAASGRASAGPANFEPGVDPVGFFSRAEAAAVGMDEAAVARLIEGAQDSSSDALIVIKDGRVVVERYFGRPVRKIPLMSVTKSFTALAIGSLIAEGKIAGLDAPLSTWFPEWAQGPKASVTLRHLLTHTSGLYHETSALTLERQPDQLSYVRALPITGEVGRWSYNNEAVELLSGIVREAAGTPLDEYVNGRVFEPMGISDWSWYRDDAGTPLAYAGLSLTARDLARVGQMMLQGGRSASRAIVPEDWARRSVSPALADASWQGLLWFVMRAGSWPGSPAGFNSNGWLGQYVVVFPAPWNIVAVRLRSATDGGDEAEARRYGFPEFMTLVAKTMPVPAQRPGLAARAEDVLTMMATTRPWDDSRRSNAQP